MDLWIGRSQDRWNGRSLDKWICGLIARWLAGSLDRWIVGSMDRWIARSMIGGSIGIFTSLSCKNGQRKDKLVVLLLNLLFFDVLVAVRVVGS